MENQQLISSVFFHSLSDGQIEALDNEALIALSESVLIKCEVTLCIFDIHYTHIHDFIEDHGDVKREDAEWLLKNIKSTSKLLAYYWRWMQNCCDIPFCLN